MERKRLLELRKRDIQILEKEVELQELLLDLGINDYIVYFDTKNNKLVAVKDETKN